MVHTLLLTLAVAAADPYSSPGTYNWGKRVVDVPSGGANVAANLYYPATAQGDNTPVNTAAGPYPVVAFAHGFVSPPAWYDSTLQHLATHGYVVIATSSQLTFAPDRLQYVSDFKASIDYLVNQNSQPGSIFEGAINSAAIGTSGHSLGGGVSIVELAQDPRVKASATFAAASLRDSGPLGPAPPPYADVEVTKVDIPVSLINGSLDGLIPVATNGQVIYNAASGPKLLPNLVGGYHTGFIDPNLPFDQGAVTQAEQLAFGRRELTTFFDLYLKGDQSVWRQVWGPERLAQAGVVDTQLDPGFTITPDAASKTGGPGGALTFDLLVKNTTDFADSYRLFSEDNQWPLSFSIDQTPVLNPGQTFSLTATITLPAAADGFDKALVSARSDRDGGTRAFTYVTAVVPEPATMALVASGVACMAVALRASLRAAISRRC